MHRHTARTNRLALAAVALVLMAGGAYLILRHLGRLGADQPKGDAVYSPPEARWIHTHSWVWIVAAIVVVVIGLLALRWLRLQARVQSVDTIALDPDVPGERTRMDADVLADAIEDDIETHAGVARTRTDVTGAPDEPELLVRVVLQPDTDAADVLAHVTGEVLPNAWTAMDGPLPVQVQLRAARRRPRGEARAAVR